MSDRARANAPGGAGSSLRGLLAALLCTLTPALAPQPGEAAEIGLSEQPGCLFALSGPIVPGDAERFGELVARHWTRPLDGPTSDNADIALCLDSPGGSFQEGHRISRTVFERAIATRIGPGAGCHSACSLVFMAGRVQGGEHDGPRRILHVAGQLGFHAPYLRLDEATDFSGATVNAFVPELTGIISDFIRQGAYRSQFQDRPSISLNLIAEMLATPQDRSFLIDTVERAARWGVDLEGIGTARPFSWMDVAQLCTNQLAWIYDSASARLTEEEFARLRRATKRVALYPEAVDFYEVTDAGLSTRVCAVKIPGDGATHTGVCLLDGYTGVGLGDCDAAADPWAVWLPWWHALPPDTPLAALQ